MVVADGDGGVFDALQVAQRKLARSSEDRR